MQTLEFTSVQEATGLHAGGGGGGDPSVIDPSHRARGKREASYGNSVPFAAKLSGTITRFLDVVVGKFETVHKDRARTICLAELSRTRPAPASKSRSDYRSCRLFSRPAGGYEPEITKPLVVSTLPGGSQDTARGLLRKPPHGIALNKHIACDGQPHAT
jgi:hypothetical protein